LTAVGPELVADVPPGPELSVRAFEVTESELHLTHRQHAIGEGRTDRQLAVGDLRLGPVGLDGRPADWSWADWAGDRAENVRAALALVERGAAPYGIVYATDTRASTRVRVAGVFPAASHPPIRYPIARLKGGGAEAEGFRRFLLSPGGQAILHAHGFTRP
jgi:molybdate transport system substrate-binding protein